MPPTEVLVPTDVRTRLAEALPELPWRLTHRDGVWDAEASLAGDGREFVFVAVIGGSQASFMICSCDRSDGPSDGVVKGHGATLPEAVRMAFDTLEALASVVRPK